MPRRRHTTTTIKPRLAPSRDADVGGSAGAPFFFGTGGAGKKSHVVQGSEETEKASVMEDVISDNVRGACVV